jgi:hypothetical protein
MTSLLQLAPCARVPVPFSPAVILTGVASRCSYSAFEQAARVIVIAAAINNLFFMYS